MRRLLLALAVLLAAILAASLANGDGTAGRTSLEQLAFIGDSGLGLMNSDGTNVRWLVRRGNPRGGLSWSPDGRQVAFFNERVWEHGAWDQGATSDLYVFNVVSRSRTLVFRNAQDTSGDDPMAAAWSPDGSRLALTSTPTQETHKIWLVAPDGRQKRLLQGEAWKPAWSPDGSTIAYEYFYGELWQVSPDGTADRLAVGGSPAWSPDGTQITYIRDGDVWVMDADGSNQTRLTDTPMEESEPVWSPHGSTIAYLRDQTSGGRVLSTHVFTMRRDGRAAKQLTRGNHVAAGISWSADGHLIAFTRDPLRYAESIVVVDVKRRSERRLVAGFDPEWRPTP
jgi:Tol biopolymer transport system component